MNKRLNLYGLFVLLLTSIFFASCKPVELPLYNVEEEISIDDFIFADGVKSKDEDGVLILDGASLADGDWAFCQFDLSKYPNSTVNIELSCEMKTDSPTAENLMWQVNLGDGKYPMVVEKEIANEWIPVSGSSNTYKNSEGELQEPIKLGDSSILYLSTH